MNKQKLTVRLSISARGRSLEALLEGVPRRVTIDEAYVSHQLWRLRLAASGRRLRQHVPMVAIDGGSGRITTSGAPLALAIAVRGLGGRASKPLATGLRWTLEKVAPEIAALTIVRKLLEDRQLFVGSRVLDADSRETLEDEGLSRLLAASCGAYKITEQADLAPSRVIRFTDSRAGASRSSTSPRSVELLASGPSGWVRRSALAQQALLKVLARRMLSSGLFTSAGVAVSEGSQGAVDVIRARGVFFGHAVRRGARFAPTCSVLAETMLIRELAASVLGWRIDGFSEDGPFGCLAGRQLSVKAGAGLPRKPRA